MAWVWPKTPESEKKFRYRPSPRWKAERQEIELNPSPVDKFITKGAPFGTEDSPVFRYKIVGGKHVPVIERVPREPLNVESPRSFPRVETLHPITDKPNHVDAELLRDYNRKYLSVRQDTINSQISGKPTNLASKRPDSKDLNSRYPPLPPIEANKAKNVILSTVFEPEPWTEDYSQNRQHPMRRSSENMNGRGQHIPLFDPKEPYQRGGSQMSNSLPSSRQQPNGYSNSLPRRRAPATLEEIKDDLALNLPKGEFLPVYPQRFGSEEEAQLMRVVAGELQNVSAEQLKNLYLDIVKRWDRMTPPEGWCNYKDLYFSMCESKVDLSPDTLRLVGAQYVSPDKPDQVNYEKFLSFIGTALQQSGKQLNFDLSSPRMAPGQRTALHEPASRAPSPARSLVKGPVPWRQYYDSNQFSRVNSPRNETHSEREMAKLLRLTENQIRDSEFTINFEKLIADFREADRDFRQTLSADKIKEICRINRIPLQESVLNQILRTCQDFNRDGQYRWSDFVAFLERVQPAVTGLPIPVSKRPLEYARQYPTPNTNWPKGRDSVVPPSPLWRREDVARRSISREGRPRSPLWTPRQEAVQRRHVSPAPDAYQQGYTEDTDVINRMDQELRDMEQEYERNRKKLNKPSSWEWQDRFLKFSQALYNQDTNNSGKLDYNAVLQWSLVNNDAYHLDIPYHTLTRALSDSAHGGLVDIYDYLKHLGHLAY